MTDSGTHLTARDIWVFLIDLFFGWVCSTDSEDPYHAQGFFWMRVFDSDLELSKKIKNEFDPLNVSMANDDVRIWLGKFSEIESEIDYPGSKPVAVSRMRGQDEALRAFSSAKRCFFFFGKNLEVDNLLGLHSTAPRFGELMYQAQVDSRPVVRQLAGQINRYRLDLDTENEVWVSRHHGMAAHRRPAGLAAAAKLPIDQVQVRVPFQYEANLYPTAGFFPTVIYVNWHGSEQLLKLDYATWLRLQGERTLTVDRDQEILDFAIDLFMAQADVRAYGDPEVLVFDHRRRQQTTLRIRPDDRQIEVLS